MSETVPVLTPSTPIFDEDLSGLAPQEIAVILSRQQQARQQQIISWDIQERNEEQAAARRDAVRSPEEELTPGIPVKHKKTQKEIIEEFELVALALLASVETAAVQAIAPAVTAFNGTKDFLLRQGREIIDDIKAFFESPFRPALSRRSSDSESFAPN